MIILDGNYYLQWFDINYRHRREKFMSAFGSDRDLDVRTNVNKVDFGRCEKLAEGLPLSREFRPAWDVSVLTKLGFDDMGILMMDTDDFTYDTAYGRQNTPVSFGFCARIPNSVISIGIEDSQDEMENVQGMINDGVEKITGTWKILSNKDCVKLLLSLYQVNMTASQAADLLGCSYSLAAHDLKLLMDSGLVSSEKVGGEKVYLLDKRQVVRDLYNMTMQANHDKRTNPTD